MFNYCPSYASKKIAFSKGKSFRCPDCGFVYYHNIAAAVGCVISVPNPDREKILFTVRAKEPGAGKLDMPGGFVDIGEGALESLNRELQEEIGWTPPLPEGKKLSDVFELFASFPNVYEYKNVKYNTCDLYFSVSAPNLKLEDLRINKTEISDVFFLKPEEINFSAFAFPSTKDAVKTYLGILD